MQLFFVSSLIIIDLEIKIVGVVFAVSNRLWRFEIFKGNKTAQMK